MYTFRANHGGGDGRAAGHDGREYKLQTSIKTNVIPAPFEYNGPRRAEQRRHRATCKDRWARVRSEKKSFKSAGAAATAINHFETFVLCRATRRVISFVFSPSPPPPAAADAVLPASETWLRVWPCKRAARTSCIATKRPRPNRRG